MVNQSQIRDSRFLDKWKESGAAEGIEVAHKRSLGSHEQPDEFPNYSVDRGTFTFTGPKNSMYFEDLDIARRNYLRENIGSGTSVQLIKWLDERRGSILAGRNDGR